MRATAPGGTGTLTKESAYLVASQPQLEMTFSDAPGGFAMLATGEPTTSTLSWFTKNTSYPMMSIWLISPLTMLGPHMRSNVTKSIIKSESTPMSTSQTWQTTCGSACCRVYECVDHESIHTAA
jgi:hypothetical protein